MLAAGRRRRRCCRLERLSGVSGGLQYAWQGKRVQIGANAGTATRATTHGQQAEFARRESLRQQSECRRSSDVAADWRQPERQLRARVLLRSAPDAGAAAPGELLSAAAIPAG